MTMTRNSMKSILTIFLCSTLNSLYSQTEHKVGFGITAGPTLSTIQGSLKPYYGSKSANTLKPSYFAGIVFDYGLNAKLSIVAEPSFETRGSSAKWYDMINGMMMEFDDARENYNYISLPLLGRYFLGEKRKFYLSAGFAAAYLLSHRSIQLADELNPNRSRDATEFTPRFDFGIPIGIGIRLYNKKNEAFPIELRQQLGVSNLNSQFENYSEKVYHSLTSIRFAAFFNPKR
jgi:hypothetical protein